jgi:hypothetical protein
MGMRGVGAAAERGMDGLVGAREVRETGGQERDWRARARDWWT